MRRIYQRTLTRIATVHAISMQSCEMQSCLYRTLLLFRCIGLFPVEGLGSSNVKDIKFNVKSAYGVYYIFTFLGQLTCLGLSIYWCYTSEAISTGVLMQILLYFTTTSLLIILSNIARNWHYVIKEIADIEGKLKGIRKSSYASFYCNMILFCIVITFIVETVTAFMFHTKVIKTCLKLDESDEENWHVVCKFFAPQLFRVTSYATWKFVLYKLANIQANILAYTMDMIVICVSIYLKSYFRDLNNVIKSHRTKSPKFWEKQRCHYTQLTNLVKLMNNQLKILIFLSLLVYLIFICIQLFFVINSSSFRFLNCDEELLKKLTNSMENMLHVTLSVLSPMTRALIACLLAADVHIEAKKPLLYLHEVLDSSYNLDIQRFRLQILYCPIYLSGSLFYITRNTILKVVSKIITYELVLLQLNRTSRLHMAISFEYDNSTKVN